VGYNLPGFATKHTKAVASRDGLRAFLVHLYFEKSTFGAVFELASAE
jgi:hypothetical protein